MVDREQRSAAKKVLIVMLIVELIVVLVIFMLTIIFSSPDSTPSFMGHSFYISDIDGMEDAVKPDSMVVAKNGRPNGSVVGGVILCENITGFGTGIFRVIGVESTSDTLIYNVCLDNAPEQTFAIDARDVVGECKYSYYTLGKIVMFVKSKVGVAVCVVIPALILAFIELILGFIKEMKKRELQKKRESVRREQARQYSTKSRRDKDFSVDDFKNEERELKKKHQRSSKERAPGSRRTVRSLNQPISDERTKLMDLSSNKKEPAYAYAKSGASDADVEDNEIRERESVPELGGGLNNRSGIVWSDDQPDTQIKNEIAVTAENTAAEALDVTIGAGTEETPADAKAVAAMPKLSLDEMMQLMQKNQEKFRKDIEDNK